MAASGLSLGSAKLQGPASDYAIVAGLAFVISKPLTPKIDLLHPRQPPAKRDLKKPYYAAAAAAALLALALVTAVYQQSLASYDSAITKLSAEERKLDSELKKGEPTFVAAKAIDEWQARNINQLKEFAELHQVMNGTERKVVSEYKFNVSSGNVLAKLGVIGNSRDRNDAEQLAQNLTDLQKYTVRPSSVTNTTRDSVYASHFDLEMELIPATASTAKGASAASASVNKGK